MQPFDKGQSWRVQEPLKQRTLKKREQRWDDRTQLDGSKLPTVSPLAARQVSSALAAPVPNSSPGIL